MNVTCAGADKLSYDTEKSAIMGEYTITLIVSSAVLFESSNEMHNHMNERFAIVDKRIDDTRNECWSDFSR
jgi:hypothetical protein